MRRLPRQLRVLGQRVPVARITNLMHEGEQDEHEHRAYGVFDPEGPMVFLDEGMGSERTKVTLVHEWLHAMLNTSKLDTVETEEELVGRLAPVLLEGIRSNRGVITYLQES